MLRGLKPPAPSWKRSSIRNRVHGGRVDAARTALLALYHDAGEVLTGDLPSPVKYFNPDMRAAYGGIERAAADRLLAMVPAALQADYRPLLLEDVADHEHWELVHAADKLCAYLKCMEEVAAGNRGVRARRAGPARDGRGDPASGGTLLPDRIRTEPAPEPRRAGLRGRGGGSRRRWLVWFLR